MTALRTLGLQEAKGKADVTSRFSGSLLAPMVVQPRAQHRGLSNASFIFGSPGGFFPRPPRADCWYAVWPALMIYSLMKQI